MVVEMNQENNNNQEFKSHETSCTKIFMEQFNKTCHIPPINDGTSQSTWFPPIRPDPSISIPRPTLFWKKEKKWTDNRWQWTGGDHICFALGPTNSRAWSKCDDRVGHPNLVPGLGFPKGQIRESGCPSHQDLKYWPQGLEWIKIINRLIK